MKILLISFEFPPQPGGIGTYSYQIAKNLSKLGNKIIALVHTNSVQIKEIEKFDRLQDFEILRFKNYNNKAFKIFHRLFYSLKVIRKNKFDLLFITYSHAGIIGIMAKYIFNIPYVMMGHGSEFLYKNNLLRSIVRLIFQHSNLNFTNSYFTSILMKKAGISNTNLKIIPLGADDDIYNIKKYNVQECRKKYGYQNRKILLTVGNLSIRKGHRYVIEATRKLIDEFPDILYLIIGRGKEEERLRKMINKYDLNRYVKLLGFVSMDYLPEYYALCDIFILNSSIAPNGDIEGFGIVLVESGLMGKPVIGTRDCGISEAIDHDNTGLLIDMDDYCQTAEAIRKLLSNDKLRKEMGENFYRKTTRFLTWKSVADKTNSEIVSLLKVNDN